MDEKRTGMKPEWFYRLSPREQRKQINRWRYYRQYFRRKYGEGYPTWLI